MNGCNSSSEAGSVNVESNPSQGASPVVPELPGLDSANGIPGATVPVHLPGAVPGGVLADFKLSCVEAQFTHLINIYRRSFGLAPLNVSKAAVLAARWHASDMALNDYFSHTEPRGRTFSARATSFGYTARGENIAAGNKDATKTFCQWKNSAGHDKNMKGSTYVSMGIGMSTGVGPYSAYWSNCFGPKANDEISEPLTSESSCAMPTVLPDC